MDNTSNAPRPLQDATNRPSANNSTLTPEGINAFGYRQLQQKCKAVGLSAGGSTEVLRQRLLDCSSGHKTAHNKREGASNDPPDQTTDSKQSNDGQPIPKRPKKAVEDDLSCPINLCLPIDPVMAEDGQIYERSAIENHIESSQGGVLKSPITRQKMGTKLFPARHVKNAIETLIEAGAITGEPASDWKESVQQKKEMEDLLKKAEGGDVKAMETVAINYDSGLNGFKLDKKMAEDWKKQIKEKEAEDLLKKAEGGDVGAMEDVAINYEWGRNGFKEHDKKAYKWFDKARVAGSLLGMSKVGNLLAVGCGAKRDKMKAMMYLSLAAGKGSDLGAYMLGKCLADGLHGFPKDKVEARIFLEKSLSGNCPHKCMNDAAKRRAQECLDQLVNQEQATL